MRDTTNINDSNNTINSNHSENANLVLRVGGTGKSFRVAPFQFSGAATCSDFSRRPRDLSPPPNSCRWAIRYFTVFVQCFIPPGEILKSGGGDKF